MNSWLLIVITGLLVSMAVLVARLRRERAHVTRRRVVEKPNSHYSAKAVKNLEHLERWESIRLDRLHEVNGEEVRKLLQRMKTLGVDSLRPDERGLLERMERAARS